MTECARKNCHNEGTAHPVILIWPKMADYKGPPAEMMLSIEVCDAHQAETTVTDFIQDEQWEFIRGMLAGSGHIEADRAKTQLTWKPIGAIDFDHPDEIAKAKGGGTVVTGTVRAPKGKPIVH